MRLIFNLAPCLQHATLLWYILGGVWHWILRLVVWGLTQVTVLYFRAAIVSSGHILYICADVYLVGENLFAKKHFVVWNRGGPRLWLWRLSLIENEDFWLYFEVVLAGHQTVHFDAVAQLWNFVLRGAKSALVHTRQRESRVEPVLVAVDVHSPSILQIALTRRLVNNYV